MASVLKKRNGKWPVQYTDALGKRRQKLVIGTKPDAKAVGVDLDRRAQAIRLGTADPRADALALHAARPIGEHVAAFERDHRTRDNTPKHGRSVIARLGRTLRLAKVKRLADITESSTRSAADALRQEKKSLQTCRHHIRALTQFTHWAKRDGRTATNPLADFRLAGFNPDRDRRHPRRELTEAETTLLMSHLEHAPDVRRVPAADRRMFYLLALSTGLRGKELRSLTPESFHLDQPDPMVHLTADAAKNERDADLPVPLNLAPVVLDWLSNRPAGTPVFARFWKAVNLLKADLAAAGVAYEDAAGEYADCHALRHTFITRLGRSGASVKTVQSLARHSDPCLTFGRYSHASASDLRAGVESAAPVLHSSATTGPDANRPDPFPALGGESQSSLGKAVMAETAGNEPMHPEGLEPPTCGSVDRRTVMCSTPDGVADGGTRPTRSSRTRSTCAQRLTASLTVAPARREGERVHAEVLNA